MTNSSEDSYSPRAQAELQHLFGVPARLPALHPRQAIVPTVPVPVYGRTRTGPTDRCLTDTPRQLH